MDNMDDGNYIIYGSSIGHFVPAVAFSLVSLAAIFHVMDRAHCVPVVDKSALRKLSIFLFTITFSGITMEFVNGGRDLSFSLLHKALYFPFMVTGIVGYMESKDLLPETTHRKLAAFAFIIHYFMFYDHAQMQGGSQRPAHEYLAHLNLGSGLAYVWSAYDKNNIEAILTSYVITLMIGLWYLTLSWMFYPFLTPYGGREHQPSTEVVGPLFIIEFAALLLLCYVIVAYKIGKNKDRGIAITTTSEEQELTGIM